MPLVYLHNPDDQKWQFLRLLGVSIEVDFSFWMSCLRNYARENAVPSEDLVSTAYRGIVQATSDVAHVRYDLQDHRNPIMH